MNCSLITVWHQGFLFHTIDWAGEGRRCLNDHLTASYCLVLGTIPVWDNTKPWYIVLNLGVSVSVSDSVFIPISEYFFLNTSLNSSTYRYDFNRQHLFPLNIQLSCCIANLVSYSLLLRILCLSKDEFQPAKYLNFKYNCSWVTLH